MKIALLSEKYTPDIGGLAISAARFARLLSSAGHEVQVFSPTLILPPSEIRTLSSDGVIVTRFGAHKRADDSLVDWFELIVGEHHRSAFDVLHAYFLTQAGFVATYAGKYLDLPSVISIRGNDIERAAFDPSKFSHVMYTLQNASTLTTNTSELVNRARAFFDREINLIPNGIDSDYFKPTARNEKLAEAIGLYRVPDGLSHVAVIGFAGELREKKGLRTLLHAYAQVNKIRPAALLIVGQVRAGEDQQTVAEFQASNPDSRIIITGYISPNDLPAYYSLMDVFVHPSLRDGMPNALLEAMACERPVLVTSVGGMLDVVKDGENGIFVPIKDSDALARAIDKVLANAELRKRLGKAARQSIIDCFSLQKELDRNLTVYRKLGLHP
ncbi:MAG TPA: glycosyltransferase family 4 protein [Anaerolineales bacterium]|nr:glycosyltransferase family 4 protein [Anaerolineales bacterium]